jgi:hypothetical protein
VRVTIDKTAVHRIVDRGAAPGMERAAKFMADRQRETTRSSRLRSGIGHESGRDAHGWYARAGMKPSRRTPFFFWYFEEYQTGRGRGGTPFIRQALHNYGRQIARMMTGGR